MNSSDYEPHIVRPGDHLLGLAASHGFVAEEVWNHGDNEHLRKAKRDPNILAPGDVIYLPRVQREWFPVTIGEVNKFVVNVPKATISVKLLFDGSPVANAAFTGKAGYLDVEGTSTQEGVISFDAPATAREATVTFTLSQRMFRFRIGHLDPIETTSGAAQRLERLGFWFGDEREGDMRERVKRSLAAFQHKNKLAVSGAMDTDTSDALRSQCGC